MRPLVLSLAVVSLVTSCNSVLGIDELPPRGPVTPSYSDSACQSCVATHCAAEERACTDDVACRPFAECTAGVSKDHPAGRYACDTNYPAGRESAPGIGLDTCRRESCRSVCLGTGGYLGNWAETCPSCLADKCASAVDACVSLARCDRGAACLDLAGDPDQYLRCVYDVAGPEVSELLDLENCWEESCRTRCALGEAWDCNGQYQWDSAKGPGPLAFEIGVKKYSDSSPLDGVNVSVCALGRECEPGAATQGGHVEVSLPFVADSQAFVGWLELERDDLVPALGFLGRPLYRYENRINFLMATPDDVNGVAALAQAPDFELASAGHVLVRVFDCHFQSAVGVAVDVSPKPPEMRTWPANQTTEAQYKAVAFLNLPATCVTVTAIRKGVPVGSQKIPLALGKVGGLPLFPKTSQPGAELCVD